MRTLSGVFDEFAAALQFPPYFGENWGAFDECIEDLEWLPATGYLLLLIDATELLVDEENAEKHMSALVRVLEKAAGHGRLRSLQASTGTAAPDRFTSSSRPR